MDIYFKLAHSRPGDRQLKAIPSVSPSYSRTDAIPAVAGEQTIRRGAEWFFKAKMLVNESWEKEYWKFRPYPGDDAPPREEWPCGDGSLGVMEGFNTSFSPTVPSRSCGIGARTVTEPSPERWPRRERLSAISDTFRPAPTLPTFSFSVRSWRAAITPIPQHPAFGLLGWHDREKYHADYNGYDIHYGADNACAVIGLLTSAAIARADRWDRQNHAVHHGQFPDYRQVSRVSVPAACTRMRWLNVAGNTSMMPIMWSIRPISRRISGPVISGLTGGPAGKIY